MELAFGDHEAMNMGTRHRSHLHNSPTIITHKRDGTPYVVATVGDGSALTSQTGGQESTSRPGSRIPSDSDHGSVAFGSEHSRVFSDGEDGDGRSDTVYDSLRTEATNSSHSGAKSQHVESLFLNGSAVGAVAFGEGQERAVPFAFGQGMNDYADEQEEDDQPTPVKNGAEHVKAEGKDTQADNVAETATVTKLAHRPREGYDRTSGPSNIPTRDNDADSTSSDWDHFSDYFDINDPRVSLEKDLHNPNLLIVVKKPLPGEQGPTIVKKYDFFAKRERAVSKSSVPVFGFRALDPDTSKERVYFTPLRALIPIGAEVSFHVCKRIHYGGILEMDPKDAAKAHEENLETNARPSWDPSLDERKMVFGRLCPPIVLANTSSPGAEKFPNATSPRPSPTQAEFGHTEADLGDWDADNESGGGNDDQSTDATEKGKGVSASAAEDDLEHSTSAGSDNISSPTSDNSDASPPIIRANIFDWSERPAGAIDNDGGESSRPRTAHPHQGLERGGRSSSRLGHNGGAHLRSHSVPLVPDAPAHRGNTTAKIEGWSLGGKGVSEDWENDFEFDNDMPHTSMSASATLRGKAPTIPEDDESVMTASAVLVPPAILAKQGSVHSQFGQVKELTVLVEELRRLRQQGLAHGLLDGHAAALWKEAEGIIDLATVDEDEPLAPGAQSPTTEASVDFDAYD